MKSIYIIVPNCVFNSYFWEMYEYYATETREGTYAFAARGTRFSIKKDFCDGSWRKKPIEGFYFTNKEQAFELKRFLSLHLYLVPYIDRLPAIAYRDAALFNKEIFGGNELKIMQDIVELYYVLTARHCPIPIKASMLRKCVSNLGLLKSDFVELYNVTVSMRAEDAAILNKLAGITIDTPAKKVAELRREALHKLIMKAEV